MMRQALQEYVRYELIPSDCGAFHLIIISWFNNPFSFHSIIQQYTRPVRSIVETDCDESIDDNEEGGGEAMEWTRSRSTWLVVGV